MNAWRPYPLLRLVIPFAAGIISEVFSGSLPGRSSLLISCLAGMLLLPLVLPAARSYRLRRVTGLAINIFFFVAGYEIACCHLPANDPDYLGKQPVGLFVAAITEPPAATRYGIRVVASVKYRIEQGTWHRTYGSAIAYLKLKPGAPQLQFGDHILLQALFSEISDNSNPHSFNYSRYLKNKGISHRVFAEAWSWQVISIKPSGFIRKAAFQVRDRLLDVLRDNEVEGKEFAVAAALLLGYVDDLDAELRNDYAATGAMHILSVSGMHVGIIYIFLEFLLGFMNKSRPGRLAKAVLLLVFIWFYAMVTGLSPCVLRSAAMLSLPIIGKSLNRSPDIHNIIAATLVFILAFDPFLVMDVGFQLSFLAVAGIVVLYKPVYDLYVTSSWLPDKIWSVVAVSIAAQVATLPITLYTFHQFPNYFMLTNVFVVPLSSLIIYVGILVLAAGAIPVFSLLCAKALIFLVWLLNSVIHFIEQLPFSTIRGIYISAPEMLLLYLLIAAVFLFLTLRRISFLYAFLVSVILLNLLMLDFRIQRLRSSRLTIFNATREALFMISTQDKAVLMYSGNGSNGGLFQPSGHEMAAADMHARGIHRHRDFRLGLYNRPAVLAKSFVPVIGIGNYLWFKGCTMVMLNGPVPKGFTGRLNAGILIITGNPKINISDAIGVFHPGQIIIDATNSRYKTRQWMQDAAKAGVQCHAVAEQGAFQKDF